MLRLTVILLVACWICSINSKEIVCGPNAFFADCPGDCPRHFCPKDDSVISVQRDESTLCEPGCICKVNYRKKSPEDPTCILAKTCPPVTCTRPNEEWDSCATGCLREDCTHANKNLGACNEFLLNCQPKCVCKKGHFRNEKGLCVTPEKCPT